MPFKINIAEKSGKTYKLELESEELLGKELKFELKEEKKEEKKNEVKTEEKKEEK